jgi:NitT/TauT family transport system substrate-binding protein
MRRRAFLLIASAVGCKQAKPAVRLVTFPESYGHHLSLGMGFYDKRSLRVEAQYLQSFPRMMEAVLAGEADVATANLDAVFPLVAQGKDVTAFCCLANRPGTVLAISPATKRSLRGVGDLKGAVIGIPGPGSSSQFLLNAVLRKGGVQPEEVSTAAIGVAAGAIAAMEQGKVDAAMMTNLGLSTLRLRHAGLKVLADLRTPEGALDYLGSAEYPTLCLVARKTWLEGHREQARLIAEAFLEANRWMASHTAQEVREALPQQARAQDAAADVEAIRGMQPTLETGGSISRKAAEAVWKVTQESVSALAGRELDWERAVTLPSGNSIR